MFYHSFCGLLDQYVHDLGNSDPEVNTSRQTLEQMSVKTLGNKFLPNSETINSSPHC